MKTRRVNKPFLFFIVTFILALFPISNAISADLSAPQIAIESTSNKLKDKLQDESFTKDFAQINIFVDNVINPHVDFNRISALVLGKLWKKATKEEKLRFKEEFKRLLIRTYSRAFLEFKDWSVRFLPLKMKEDTRKVIVKTEILQPGIQPLSVNYRMVLSRGEWKVYDIMIEGVSLVTNYRTSFKNEVKKSGSLMTVIDQLEKKNTAALLVKTES